MPRKQKTYKVVGAAPVTVDAQTYHQGDEFDAHEKDVAFLLEIGAIETTKKD